jgi:hypothetical protein
MTRTELNGFERHVQTVLATVIVAILLWSGATLLDVRDRLIRLEEHQKLVERRLQALEIETSQQKK